MQTREKILAGAFGGMIVIGWIVPSLWTAVRSPVTEREKTLRSVKRRLDVKEDDEMKTLAAISKIAGWKKRALSEDALTAQRVYQVWLTQLADEAGWRDLDVRPGSTKRVGPGSSVSVSVEGRATVDQLAEFLRRFDQAGLLHSVESSTMVAETTNPDVPLEVTVTATALSLPDGGSTPLPYAEFAVTEETNDATTASVSPALAGISDSFEVEALIGSQWRYAKVKKTDESGRWLLSWDGDTPDKLASGTKFRTRPLAEASSSAFWDRLADNSLFAIPRSKDAPAAVVQRTPKKENLPPRLASIDSGSVLPGELWETSILASDPDGDDDAIRLSLVNGPRGARLSDGVLQFVSTRTASPAEIEITVSARDANGGEVSQTTTVTILPDPEQTTALIGAVRIDDVPSAMFIDYQSGERFVKRVGDQMKAGRFEAKIESIGSSEVVFVSVDAESRLELGDVLSDRKSTPVPAQRPADSADAAPKL